MSLYKNDGGIFEGAPGLLRAIGAFGSSLFANSAQEKFGFTSIHKGVIFAFTFHLLITLGYLLYTIYFLSFVENFRDIFDIFLNTFVQSLRIFLLVSLSILALIFSSRIFPVLAIISHSAGIFGNKLIFYPVSELALVYANMDAFLYISSSFFEIPFDVAHNFFGYSLQLKENFDRIYHLNLVINTLYMVAGIVATSELMLLKKQANKGRIRTAYSAFAVFSIAMTIIAINTN